MASWDRDGICKMLEVYVLMVPPGNNPKPGIRVVLLLLLLSLPLLPLPLPTENSDSESDDDLENEVDDIMNDLFGDHHWGAEQSD